jgi:hypothetical protein
MKQIVELSELSIRASAVRWTLADLSLAAGMARSTAYQVVSHQNPTRKTHDALSDAQIAEEIRLRDYLNALHPVASPETKDAA